MSHNIEDSLCFNSKSCIDKDQYKKSQSIKGLPNIGNTCFLNSILQQLFALKKFRQAIIERMNKDSNTTISILGKIFLLMKSTRDQQQEIRLSIRKFINKIENELFDYRFGQQNDSFDTLMTIFNCIFDEEFEISNMFKVQYSIKCGCYEYQAILEQFYFTFQQEECQSCGQQYKTTLINQVEYLIIKHNRKSQNIDVILSFADSDKRYQLSSTNVYVGSGLCGHYYSNCKCKDKYLKCNDNLITYVNNPITQNNHFFSIYTINTEQNIKNSDELDETTITQFYQVEGSIVQQEQYPYVYRTNLSENIKQQPIKTEYNILKSSSFDKISKAKIEFEQNLKKIEGEQMIDMPNKPIQDIETNKNTNRSLKLQIVINALLSYIILFIYIKSSSIYLLCLMDVLTIISLRSSIITTTKQLITKIISLLKKKKRE